MAGAIIGHPLIGTIPPQAGGRGTRRAGALQPTSTAPTSRASPPTPRVIQIFNVGAERMLGYTAAEVMNKITPADISDPQEVVARDRAQRRARNPDHAGLRSPGLRLARHRTSTSDLHPQGRQPLPAVVSVTVLRDAQGGIIGYLLTEHNTARQQSKRSGASSISGCATALLHPPLIVQYRRADDLRSARHHHRHQQADRIWTDAPVTSRSARRSRTTTDSARARPASGGC